MGLGRVKPKKSNEPGQAGPGLRILARAGLYDRRRTDRRAMTVNTVLA